MVFEAARRVKPRGDLMGDPLIMDKAIPRWPNGWPARKGALASISRPSMRAISAPTRVAQFSKFWAMFGPHLE